MREATNLLIEDFQYRSLVVDDIWIPLGESMLIERFKPVWNILIDGFGNKDPGNRRATQFKSPWDILHPGRAAMEKLADSGVKPEALVAKLDAYFKGENVPLIEVTQADDEADS